MGVPLGSPVCGSCFSLNTPSQGHVLIWSLGSPTDRATSAIPSPQEKAGPRQTLTCPRDWSAHGYLMTAGKYVGSP